MKYKYYLGKPPGEIAKDVLSTLAIAGVVAIAATSPYFIVNVLSRFKTWKKYKKKRLYDIFYKLRRGGYLTFEYQGHQLYIRLTPEGEKKAGWLQINNLRIAKQNTWDRKWRIVIFDIPDKKRIKREALRGFLKRLQFYKLQKSVWIHPYDCKDEIELLKEFFSFKPTQVQLIIAERIDNEEDIRKIFHL